MVISERLVETLSTSCTQLYGNPDEGGRVEEPEAYMMCRRFHTLEGEAPYMDDNMRMLCGDE